MFYDAMATTIESATRNQLDDLSNQVWLAYGAGALADDQAQHLQEIIQQRRGPARGLAPIAAVKAAAPPRYWIKRSPEQRSPDRRASLLRRRQHAATGPLPPNLAANFTTGEQAVLKIIADEYLAHGLCDLSRNEIGARAGVSLTVVKQAIGAAENDNTMIKVERRPRSGRKHLTNIIRIVRAEWLDWLAKGHRKAYAIKACTSAKPDFALARGSQKNPPRAQVLKNSGTERVDKTGEKGNRTAASRG
jgi:hypothetical protein